MKIKKEDAPKDVQRKQANNTTKRIGKKDRRMLEIFTERGELGLNSPEAFKEGDTCLSQTVIHLNQRFDLFFSREAQKVKNRFHSITIFTRYWLKEGERRRAIAILDADSKLD